MLVITRVSYLCPIQICSTALATCFQLSCPGPVYTGVILHTLNVMVSLVLGECVYIFIYRHKLNVLFKQRCPISRQLNYHELTNCLISYAVKSVKLEGDVY